ncbi:MAG: hypothetical protein IJV04_01400 [Lachnospiraceae bacterium]|nr:hypothetical protein [Lachnospiraceae bacterium]
MRSIKRTAALALVIFIGVCAILPGAGSFVKAAGNKDIIHISTEQDLRKLAQKCRRDQWSAGRIIVLDNDITLVKNRDLEIASFAGTFEGGGHSIKNVAISEVASSTGFFGIIFKRGKVANLTIEGKYKTEGTIRRIGGIAGSNYGTIDHCTFRGTIHATSEVGGIVGHNYDTGVVSGCQSFGALQGDSFCGGICGFNEGRIVNDRNKAKVNTKYEDQTLTKEQLTDAVETIMMGEDLNRIRSYRTRMDVGGIAGFSEGEVFACTNEGTVGYEHVGYNTGGIAGRSTGFVNSCTNQGTVCGRKDIGGVVGQQQPFLIVDFSEGDLGELDAMVKALGDSANSTLTNASGHSLETTNHLLEITNLSDKAVADIQSVTDTAHEGGQKLSDVAAETIDVGRVTVDEIDDYVNDLLDALDDLDEELLDKDAAARLTDTERSSLHSTIESIKSTLTAGHTGRNALERISSYFDNLLAFRNATRSGIVQTLTLLEKLSAVSDGELIDAVDDLNDALQQDNDIYDDIMDLLDTNEEFNDRTRNLGDDLDTAANQLYGTLGQLTDAVEETSKLLNSNLQASITSMQDMQAQSDRIRQKVNDIVHKAMDPDTFTEDRTEDISAENIEAQRDGRTTACHNYGRIEADTNVGGITGTMGFELELDPEEDIKKNGRNTFDYVLRSKCVTDRCINRGEVIANRSTGGGVVGQMELGLVTASFGNGDVEVKGDYAGGVCGYSAAEIADSFSKQYTQGERYVGGIAGYGSKVHGCASMSCIGEATQFVGAICGNVEEVISADIHDNYFYVKGIYGIDGVSYKGVAQELSYDRMLRLPGAPAEFSTLILTFEAEDEIIARVECEYGKALKADSIPKVPNKDGFFGHWKRTDFSKILSDDRIKAKYERIETLIASSLTRENDRPVLIAEGRYKRGDTLYVKEEPVETTMKYSDLTGLEETARYTVRMPEDGRKTHTLRYLPSRRDHSIRILLYDDKGRATVVPTKSFGAYQTFKVEGTSFRFGVEEYWEGLIPTVIAVVALVFLAGFIIFIIRFRQGKILLQRFIRWASEKVQMKKRENEDRT